MRAAHFEFMIDLQTTEALGLIHRFEQYLAKLALGPLWRTNTDCIVRRQHWRLKWRQAP